nr:PREDICTED: uncharacterized protein LOC106704543 isoform X1 [Latimeria chalumnae]|eukprot:XP_014347265.1 PREDICTED: uncharacterized protein LOC106704543 isoform X1 [Latimeria chalumnae]
MTLVGKCGDHLSEENEIKLEFLNNKETRQMLVDEINSFLDSSESIKEADALRTENKKLKNANSRLRYKTKDWALRKDEYESEIQRLSNEISTYVNITNFWYQEAENFKESYAGSNAFDQAKKYLRMMKRNPKSEAKSTQTDDSLGPKKRTVSTQTDEVKKRTVATQTSEDDVRRWPKFSLSRSKKGK